MRGMIETNYPNDTTVVACSPMGDPGHPSEKEAHSYPVLAST